jgi:YfiH family protein
LKKLLRKSSGIFFIGVGIAGLVLPILQGTPFLLLGISMLSPELGAKLRRRFFLGRSKAPLIVLDEWNGLGVRAAFTTRRFPAHLSSTEDLAREDARAALRALWPASGPRPDRFAYLKQVHGKRVLPVRRSDFRDGDFLRMGEADALATAERALALLVLSADCLPVFFVALRGDKPAAVALAHAGWRGTREGVAARTLEVLREISGAPASDVRAAFGPSIDFKNYEVGEEFAEHFPHGDSLRRVGEKLYFDLRRENRRQLIAAGLAPKHVIDTELSSVAQNALFYSFRVEKDRAGRTVSSIWMV